MKVTRSERGSGMRPDSRPLLWVCVAGLLVAGCPWGTGLGPPFNASGWFDGSWDGVAAGSEEALVECVMAVGLAHDPAERRHHVDGMVRFTFWCAEPEDAAGPMGWPRELEFDVAGVVWPCGRLTLRGSTAGDFGEAHLHLAGEGEDRIGDGSMDGLFGEFCLTVNERDGTDGSVSGTFGVIHLE